MTNEYDPKSDTSLGTDEPCNSSQVGIGLWPILAESLTPFSPVSIGRGFSKNGSDVFDSANTPVSDTFRSQFSRAFCKSITVCVFSARGLIFPAFPSDALNSIRLPPCGGWIASGRTSGYMGAKAGRAASIPVRACFYACSRRLPFAASKSMTFAFCVAASGIPLFISDIVSVLY
jgi:hypothetical protein